MLGRFMFEPCNMDEVEFHAPPRESKSKRWLSFHPFSGVMITQGSYFMSFQFNKVSIWMTVAPTFRVN